MFTLWGSKGLVGRSFPNRTHLGHSWATKRTDHDITTIRAMRHALQIEGQAIPQAQTQTLIRSMRSDVQRAREHKVAYTILTLMWKWFWPPIWLCNELRNCYDKYSNDLDDIDTKLIIVAYMKFANICVHSIRIDKCLSGAFSFFWWVFKLRCG